MKELLTISKLIKEAKIFCEQQSEVFEKNLYGVTDGKAVGTFIEHKFTDHLSKKYLFSEGNSASGIDLPSVKTDIKVTSIKQPQSSCPYKDSKQKIYGLGYNLLIFVYEKIDDSKRKMGKLNFVSCTFIRSERTGDYQITTNLNKIIENKGNVDDIFAFLSDHNIPADDITLYNISKEILKNPPKIGYLTISNALQWRLQYGRVVNLNQKISGITPIIKYAVK